jgi:hypothetical protein
VERQLDRLARKSDKNNSELKSTIEKLQETQTELGIAIEKLKKQEQQAEAKPNDNQPKSVEKAETEKPARQIIIEDEKPKQEKRATNRQSS